jgi:hypothetical protein
VSTPDGAVFVPGVAGEGLLAGNVTDLNGATALTVMVEHVVQPGSSGNNTLFARMSASGATTTQFLLTMSNSGTRWRVVVGDGAATQADATTGASTLTTGVRYRLFVRFDGAAGTDATKLTFWLAVYDPSTNTFGVVAQSATTVAVAGFPAALITLANANVAVGRRPDVTSATFFGLLGGNGTSIRVWNSALTEAEMNAEVASSTPVIAAGLAYNFSGSTPFTNLGTAGAVGDLTAGANTVLCSGDRRYAQLASPGTSRPSYVTSGVAPVCTFDGVNDYLRNVSVGQLGSVTADGMIVRVGTLATADVSLTKTTATLSVGSNNGLRTGTNTIGGGGGQYASTPAASVLDVTIPPQSGVRVVMASRDSNLVGSTRLRDGLSAEVSASQTPLTSAAITRFTVGANFADTPAGFADLSATRILNLRGVTDADTRQAVAELVSAWAARYAGATV